MNPELSVASIELLDARNQGDRKLLVSYQNAIDDTLACSFDDYRGISYFYDRVIERNCLVWLAFTGQGKKRICGISYIRPNGKRDGTAVRPEYRKLGLGSQLVAESIKVLSDQFSFVQQGNKEMQTLLKKHGFKYLDKTEAFRGLFELSEYLDVCNVRIENGIVVFDRMNRKVRCQEYDFCVLKNF